MGQRASNTATITFNDTEIPARPPDRRGEQGLQARDDDPRPHAPRRGGDGHRHRARGASSSRPSYSKERVQFGVPIAMHQAIQFLIADMATKVHLSRLADLELRRPARPGQAQHARVLARQALRRRHRDGGHHRRRAGLRRLRLHQGLPGREAHARREDHAALRRHVADPAPRDRARDPAPAPHRGARRGRSLGAMRSLIAAIVRSPPCARRRRSPRTSHEGCAEDQQASSAIEQARPGTRRTTAAPRTTSCSARPATTRSTARAAKKPVGRLQGVRPGNRAAPTCSTVDPETTSSTPATASTTSRAVPAPTSCTRTSDAEDRLRPRPRHALHQPQVAPGQQGLALRDDLVQPAKKG